MKTGPKTIKTVKHVGFPDNSAKPKPNPQAKQLSRTMELPLTAVFEDIPLKNKSFIEVQCPGLKPFRMPLAKNEIIIGRDAGCHIQLPLTNVSRNHSKLSCNGEEYRVDDLNSTNGTFVNGVKVSGCILRNNDLIRIGECKILFVQQKVTDKE